MKVRFLQNLGTDDAQAAGRACECTIDASKCTLGAVVEIPDKAAAWLSKKYVALFEQAGNVKAVSKDPEITGK
jgi:hypothetical protein